MTSLVLIATIAGDRVAIDAAVIEAVHALTEQIHRTVCQTGLKDGEQ